MADEKKTERERVVAFLKAQAADAARRADTWTQRGRDDMAGKKEWEATCAEQWAEAIEKGSHDHP